VAYKRNSLLAKAPSGLATLPKQYQLAGLRWMLGREVKVSCYGGVSYITKHYQPS
jgi:hypothetical protein